MSFLVGTKPVGASQGDGGLTPRLERLRTEAEELEEKELKAYRKADKKTRKALLLQERASRIRAEIEQVQKEEAVAAEA